MSISIKQYIYAILVLITSLVSCSTVRQIRPLDKNQSSLTVSLGGPVTEVCDIYIPLPLISLGYNRGIVDKKLDIEVGLQITQILYGIFHTDLGINYRPWQNQKWLPGFIVSPKFFLTTDFEPSSFRIYPDLGLTFLWEIRSNWYIFTGIENFYEFSLLFQQSVGFKISNKIN